MKMTILCMRDSVAGIYLQPFATLSVASASRDLGDALQQDPHLPWQKYPQDFELYKVGEFDDADATLTSQEKEFLFRLDSLKKSA